MSNTRVLTVCWLALVIATAATVYLGGSMLALGSQVAAILLVAIIKSGLIIDGFMELRHVERRWRLIMYGWPLAMSLIIAVSLLIPYLTA
ncbi:MAG TPA: cytochrome C oxidase subunit IV family protein [Thiopseudomonas sp.]|nr:cytochrome C oxidase subunit IV family protein [Thiopseudomonas sp.]